MYLKVLFTNKVLLHSTGNYIQLNSINKILSEINYFIFLDGSDSKESTYKTEDQCLIPGLGRFPGEENGNPFLYSCLENLMDRGAWWATVHGVAKRWTQLKD